MCINAHNFLKNTQIKHILINKTLSQVISNFHKLNALLNNYRENIEFSCFIFYFDRETRDNQTKVIFILLFSTKDHFEKLVFLMRDDRCVCTVCVFCERSANKTAARPKEKKTLKTLDAWQLNFLRDDYIYLYENLHFNFLCVTFLLLFIFIYLFISSLLCGF